MTRNRRSRRDAGLAAGGIVARAAAKMIAAVRPSSTKAAFAAAARAAIEASPAPLFLAFRAGGRDFAVVREWSLVVDSSFSVELPDETPIAVVWESGGAAAGAWRAVVVPGAPRALAPALRDAGVHRVARDTL